MRLQEEAQGRRWGSRVGGDREPGPRYHCGKFFGDFPADTGVGVSWERRVAAAPELLIREQRVDGDEPRWGGAEAAAGRGGWAPAVHSGAGLSFLSPRLGRGGGRWA